ncbi:hypothetical protein [Polyangium sp. 15x6]|uniref:hypothetical protein n=1 Tax=Polyangium sp. 15x6 TaxID=3042687 RepID=UPI00249BDE9F|nr:hypothetical protein [Polyangium sp. 15x6]
MVRLDQVAGKSGGNLFKGRIKAVRAEFAEREKLLKSYLAKEQELNRTLGRQDTRRATSGPTVSQASGGGSFLGSGGTGGLGGNLGSLAAKAGLVGAAIGLFKSGLDLATDALKQFGGFLISDVIKPAFELETKSQQISNASGGAISAKDIQDKTRAAALKHNMASDQLLGAAEKFIDLTGDPKQAFEVLDTIGTLAKARGANTEELAEFAATLKNFDPNATTADINNLLLTQLAQGDKGSVPLKEAARLGGRLTAPAAFLAGNTDVRMASMGALLQTARKGFGSTDELATGIGNLINEVSSQKMVGSKKYLNAEGQIGDVGSLIAGILKETKGDAKKIGALGLSDPASKLVKAYLPTLNEKGGGAEGAKAVEDLIRSFMKARTSIESERENERKVLQTSGEKWNATIAKLKDRLLVIMPEVDKFVSKFTEIAPQFGDALVTLAKVMVKLANFLAGLFGDETDVDTDSTGQARGEYRMNFETGQFEFTPQSKLNEEKKASEAAIPFQPGMSLSGKPVEEPKKAEQAKAEIPTAAPGVPFPVLSTLATPANAAAPAQGQAPTDPKLKALSDQMDQLSAKGKTLGIVFEKLAEAGVDVARNKPLTER